MRDSNLSFSSEVRFFKLFVKVLISSFISFCFSSTSLPSSLVSFLALHLQSSTLCSLQNTNLNGLVLLVLFSSEFCCDISCSRSFFFLNRFSNFSSARFLSFKDTVEELSLLLLSSGGGVAVGLESSLVAFFAFSRKLRFTFSYKNFWCATFSQCKLSSLYLSGFFTSLLFLFPEVLCIMMYSSFVFTRV
uniref:Uncharacterized protein n=1 Tax=Cacopsylla melanoneura TaxID=428564 RepID=A0A8D8W294_9HEMI